MALSQYKQILVLLVIVTLVISCGGSEEKEQKELTEVAPTPAPVENTMLANIEKQNEIEQQATNTLDNATVAENFSFESQRSINIDLHFEATQFQEKISIYSTVTDQPNTPESLLEQGTIIQANRYKSQLTAPTMIESLMVVRNDNFSTAITLTINSDALLTHTFLE